MTERPPAAVLNATSPRRADRASAAEAALAYRDAGAPQRLALG